MRRVFLGCVLSVCVFAWLRLEELNRDTGAEEHPDQVDLDDCLHNLRWDLGERPPAAVDARIINPVVHRAQSLFCKRREGLDALRGGDVGDGAIDATLASLVLLPDRLRMRINPHVG